MHKTVVIGFALVLLTGCAAPATPAPTQTPIIQTVVVTQLVLAPTLESLATYTPRPTFTPYPTYTPAPPVVVTATPIPPTATPLLTSTPTRPPTATTRPTVTPSPTYTPDATLEAIAEEILARRASRGDGFYLVGVDISPGTWRSESGYDQCYWERNNRQGDILGNHFGLSGGVMTIRGSDFQVHLHRYARAGPVAVGGRGHDDNDADADPHAHSNDQALAAAHAPAHAHGLATHLDADPDAPLSHRDGAAASHGHVDAGDRQCANRSSAGPGVLQDLPRRQGVRR